MSVMSEQHSITKQHVQEYITAATNKTGSQEALRILNEAFTEVAIFEVLLLGSAESPRYQSRIARLDKTIKEAMQKIRPRDILHDSLKTRARREYH
jgi:hypothetical protein